MDILKQQKVDYIKLHWEYHDRPVIKLVEHHYLNYYILDILIKNPYRISEIPCEREWEREMKRVQHKLKKYSILSAGIHLDSVMEKVLDKEGLAFDSRKQELLRNAGDVLERIKGMQRQNRNQLLIILEGDWFTLRELEYLLVVAKDIYEDITVFSKNSKVLDSRAFSYMENEWGVVINRISDRTALQSSYDSVLCVIEKWNGIIWNLCFENCYVLSKEALSEDVKTEIVNNNQDSIHQKHLYSGYQYYWEDKLFPYDMAVDLLNQHQNEKFKPTFVAICEVKC